MILLYRTKTGFFSYQKWGLGFVSEHIAVNC